MNVKTVCIAALAGALTLPGSTPAAPASPGSDATSGFEVVVLDNGLTVLLAERHAHPIIACDLYVTTGGRTEDEYYQGSLHYIEHLVFKGGTPNLAPTEFRKRMSTLGRESGGWTWDDEINFGFEAPVETFSEAFRTFREGLLDLQFEQEWFEAEKKVVFQEMERGFERPGNLLYNAWDATAFTVHPYGRPVIGSEKAVRELDMHLTEAYYRERFTPNHMILCLAGDFERDEILREVGEVFGGLSPGPASFELGLPEPEQLGPRTRVDHLTQATSTELLTGVLTPGGSDPDVLALDVLAALLNDSTAGLPQYLVEQEKWVTGVFAGHYVMRDHGAFRIWARFAPENTEAVRAFIQDFVMSFDATAIPRSVFDETLRSMIADEARQRETLSDLSSRIGVLASRRGLDRARAYLDELRAVTPEDVQAAKERWLRPRRVTTAIVHPQDVQPGDVLAVRVEPEAPPPIDVPDLDAAGALVPPSGEPLAFTPASPVDGVYRYDYENGLTLIVRPRDASELLAASARVLGGQWVEPPEKAGINRFVAELGMRETRRWDREGFDRLTASLAIETSAHISVGSRANTSRQQDYRDSGAHHVVALRSQAPEILAILKETLFFPSFEETVVEKLRSDLLDEVRRLPENNLEYIKQEFYARAYRGHPYGRPTAGTEETLASITAQDLRAFHDAHWTPDRTVVSLVGNVEPAEMADWIASHWSDVPAEPAGPVVRPELPAWSPPAALEALEMGKDQWTVNWGRPGVSFDDDHAFAVSTVLSRLAGDDHFYKYVYDMGVSYRSWIRFWPNWGAGTWILENDVQRERFDETLAAFESDLSRYVEEGFGEDVFGDAIQKLRNAWVLGAQDNSVMAWRLAVAVGNGANIERVTRAVDAIEGVGLDEVNALARDVFRPDGIYRLAQK